MVLSVWVEDLVFSETYCVRLVIISVNFAGIFYIMGFFAIGVFLGLVVVETVGIFNPGGDVDLNAGWWNEYCGPLGGVLVAVLLIENYIE